MRARCRRRDEEHKIKRMNKTKPRTAKYLKRERTKEITQIAKKDQQPNHTHTHRYKIATNIYNTLTECCKE